MTMPIIGSQRAKPSAAKGAWQSAGGSGTPASLTETGTSNVVVFAINPTKMELSHGATPDQRKAVTKQTVEGSQEKAVLHADAAAVQDLGTTNFKLNDLTFDGADVVKTCNQILNWTNPSTPTTGTKNPTIPQLTFTWGPLSYTVFLTNATITYERFTPAGKPIRAKVGLTFIVNPPLPTLTNPTSGGIQGRRSHRLVAGENLQHVAMTNYGRPGAWRALAAANGIEDPLAVRPGTVIFVPAATELADGRPG
jgi:Contractile injection system tube protein